MAAQHDRRRRLFALAAERGRRARRHRHASLVRLPRAADHPDRALPPGRGRAQVRRLAQQHLLAARPRGHPGRRPGRARLRPAAAGAAAAAGDLGQLAVPGRARLRAAQRPHPDLHQELSALRRAGRVRQLGRVRRLHRVPRRGRARSSSTRRCGGRSGPHFVVRHRRGPDLRRPGDRGGVRRAGGADRRLRGPGGPGYRCRRAVHATSPAG